MARDTLDTFGGGGGGGVGVMFRFFSSDLLYTHLCTQFMFLPFDMGCFYCKKGTGIKKNTKQKTKKTMCCEK